MSIKENYIEWLAKNPKGWSSATVEKYESAVRSVSNDMYNLGVINKNIYYMNNIELDVAILFILKNEEFIKKDRKGNHMYSNGLKQFRAFIASTFEDCKQETSIKELESKIFENPNLEITEKEAIIADRIGQGVFRKQLVDRYGRCLITHVDNPKLLVAGHIKPWSQSDNYERISVYNGLLLTPTYDKLFDYGLITFSKIGKLYVSSLVGEQNEKRLNIPKNEKFELCKELEFEKNMEYHRDVLFVS